MLMKDRIFYHAALFSKDVVFGHLQHFEKHHQILRFMLGLILNSGSGELVLLSVYVYASHINVTISHCTIKCQYFDWVSQAWPMILEKKYGPLFKTLWPSSKNSCKEAVNISYAPIK